MTRTEARVRIESYLKTNWELTYPTNPLDLGNLLSVDINQLNGLMYMQSSISFSDSKQSAMVGSNSPYRVGGSLFFHIYTAAGKGTIEAVEVFDFLSDLIDLKTISGIIFKTTREVSESQPIDLYRLSLVVQFTYDSHTT